MLIAGLMTEKVKNEDGVLISTKEMELLGTVRPCAGWFRCVP